MLARGDVWRLVRTVVAAIASAAIAACHSPRPTTMPAPDVAAAPPLCGVLIAHSTEGDPDRTAFLIPVASDGPKVRRYDVADHTRHPMTLSVYAGWWICVTEGRITAEPGADYWELGSIEIADFKIDQFNPERGQE